MIKSKIESQLKFEKKKILECFSVPSHSYRRQKFNNLKKKTDKKDIAPTLTAKLNNF